MGADAHRNLLNCIGLSPIATVVSNPRRPDNPIVIANQAFCELTGYREEEIVGRNCRFLAGPRSDPRTTARIREAIIERRPILVEILNYKKDGTPFRNGVMILPLFDANGDLEYFLGSQVDLGPPEEFDRRRLAAADRIAELPLRQREVLEAMAQGLLNKQIAHKLGIAEKTVKMHRALMLERLGAATSADAIRLAVEAGL